MSIVNKSHDETVKPLVFVNQPISSLEDDVIGVSAQIDIICEAIDSGSTMIGLIADYGSGKSSLTELLCQKVKKNYPRYPEPIKVNMWDSIDKEDSSEPHSTNPTNREVSRLTKSFLYQLSMGRDWCGFFSNYINRRLSKNHGNISFSVGSMRFWWLFILSAVSYGFYLIGANEKLCVARLLPEASEKVRYVLRLLQAIHPIFLILAAFLLIIGIANTCVVFSHWKNQDARETEMNDVFDLYNRIIKHIKPVRKGKRIIVVEDLDRIGDKSVIIGFMKELYRFQNVAKKHSQKFVFVVAIKPEDALKTSEQEPEKSGRVYSKLFDITIPLKPIHYDDYSAVLLKLINDDETKSRLEKVLGKEIDKSVLPEELSWLIVGENLTVRDLKERLNHAIMIMLSRGGYTSKNSVKFESCAAVTYLESQYPSNYLKLIKNEQKFAELMTASVSIIDENKDETEANTVEKLKDKFNQVFGIVGQSEVSYRDDFKKDLCIMICRGILDYDFRMYFYTYPSGSHVKTTDERKICDMLRMPNKHSDFDGLDDAVKTTYEKGENAAVAEVIRGLERYPEAVLMNKTLIEVAGEISWEKIANATIECFVKAGRPNDIAIDFWKRIREAEFSDKELFLQQIVKQICSLPASERILRVRRQMLEAYHGDIQIVPTYQELFFDGEGSYVPLITSDEIELIDDVEVSMNLIDSDLLSDNEFSYISDLVCRKPLIGEAQKKAREILSCFVKIDTEGIGESLLKFLKINCLTDDEFFHICCHECEDDQIIAYLNALDAKKLPDQYYKDINEYVHGKGLSVDILAKLASKGLYRCVLLHEASEGEYWILDQARSNTDAIVAGCQWLCDEDEDAFIKIRHHLCIEIEDEDYRALYEGEFPFITQEEYVSLSDTSTAIQRINVNLIAEDNYATLIEIIHKKEYTPAEGMLLICHIFDSDGYHNSLCFDSNLASSIAEMLDYRLLHIRGLRMEDRESVYALLMPAFDFLGLTLDEQMRKLNCFVESVEEAISRSDENQYYELISNLDELTTVGMKYLSEHHLTVGLSERLATKLRKRGDDINYVIATALRNKDMRWEEDISTESYFKIYCHVDEMYEIMSGHWAFLEAIQKPGYLNKLLELKNSARYIEPIYKVPQHYEFFEWMMSDRHTVADQEKYLDTITEFASEEDSFQIQQIICRQENMELLGNKTRYGHIWHLFWKSEHKGPYTRAWNKRWSDELGKA